MRTNRMTQKSLKKGLLGLGILIAALAVFQNPAQAKMMRGGVVAVKDGGSSFSFKRSNPSNPSDAKQFDIVMLPSTKLEKFNSLKELRAGDEIVVDAAKKKESGIWEANSIRMLKVQLYQENLAPKVQPK